MNVTLLPPGADLIAALASELHPRGKDYSRMWVVFPETRPGHYLRKALAEREACSFIPPVIDSLDGFVNRLYEDRLGFTGRLIDSLDAVALLFDIHRQDPAGLGGAGFLSPDAFFPLGLKILGDLEEVTLAGAGPEDLRGVEGLMGETVPMESLLRLQSLAQFQKMFHERLAHDGYSTQASRLRTVVDTLRPEHLSGTEAVIFAGLYPLAKLERELIRRLLDWGLGRLFLNQARGWDEVLKLLDLPPDPQPLDPEANKKTEAGLEFTKCPDTHGQVFAMNKALSSELQNPSGLRENQAIILCASETLFPLYQQSLASLPAEAYNISLGYPLARTPLFSFFDKLLELVQSQDEAGRVYIPHYLRFVLHPYAKNIYFPGPEKRADLTRVLIHAVEAALTKRRMKTFWDLGEFERDEDLRQALQERTATLEDGPDVPAFLEHLRSIHDRTIRMFRELRDVEDFAEKLIRVLETVSIHSTAPLHHFFHPYAEAMFRQLNGLRNSLFKSTAFRDTAGYVQLFRKVIREGTVPFLGTPLRGLQVLGFWEARGLPLEDITLLDMNEDIIPAFSRTDSLLPYSVRLRLSLPTYEDLERRMSFYLHALLGRARKARVFFVENADKERSRFVEQLIWTREKTAGRPQAGTSLRTVQYRVALKLEKPGPLKKTPEMAAKLREFRFSASSLDLYLRCPLQFYYRFVLDIREAEEVSDRMEKKDIGTFVHDVLQDFFQACLGRAMQPRDLDTGRLREVIDRSFRKFYGGDEAGSAFLLKRQTERHLADFLDRYQIPLLEDLRSRNQPLIIDSLEATWKVERNFERGSYLFAARTDRVEQRGEDIYILDYKTGARETYLGISFDKLDLKNRETWGGAVKSLQLPVYSLVLSQALGLPAERLKCCFLMLGKNNLGRNIEYSPFDLKDETLRREQTDRMAALTGLLLEEICDAARPYEPRGYAADMCQDCPYRTLCR